MGLDVSIYRARTKKVFRALNWYDSKAVQEVYYARKFWTLIEQASFIDVNRDCGDFIRLSHENVEELLQIAAHNADYFDGFQSVPSLCEILRNFDDDEENGYHYYMEFEY